MSLANLRDDVRKRDETDKHVSFWWILIAPVFYYKLISRRNNHFKRWHHLAEDLISITKDLASKKGVDVEAFLAQCERTLRDTKDEEGEKGAVLWPILSLVTGIAIVYILYFLTKDFYKHGRRETHFYEDIRKALTALGSKVSWQIETPMPERSFAKYLILSLITLGIFVLYWLWVIKKDPEAHFTHHVRVETELLEELEKLSPET